MIWVSQVLPPAEWGSIAPYLMDAVEHSSPFVTPKEIVAKVNRGEYQLWLAKENITPIAAAITQIGWSGDTKVFEVLLVGGERIEEWFEKGLFQMEGYARDAKCERLWFRGRRGWGKFLKQLRPQAEYLISMEWDLGQSERTTDAATDSHISK